jgi:hypothetical protein
MILHIIAFIIILFLVAFIYIRLKYRFWALQPVAHFYDVYYWFVDSGIIMEELPPKNKFYNPIIKTVLFEDVNEINLTKFAHFIHLNYIFNKTYKENKFSPKLQNISPYFEGHNTKCFWTSYLKPQLLQDIKSNEIIEDVKLISTITSRPLHVTILKDGMPNINIDVYYVDYLCVHKENRKSGIAQQMIQTHEYNQRHSNKSIKVSLFKREEDLTGIIPLCIYDTYGFDIFKWKKPDDFPATLKFLLCDKQNMYYLMDFIRTNQHLFDIQIIPEISNIIALIESGNIFVYMLMEDTNILAAYFFRKTCVYVKHGEEVLSCFASINATAPLKIFTHGFKIAFWKIKEKFDDYKYLVVEKISHNDSIIQNLIIKTHPVISKTAYFFYNFAYHTFDSNRTFIIN